MDVLVIFDKTADESLYQPLLSGLDSGFKVFFEQVSAYNNLEKLQSILNNNHYDLVISGGSLGAHLPGLIAANTKKPVLGLPLASQWEGLDALMSLQQSPFGLPVLTSAPDRTSVIIQFLRHLQKKNAKDLLQMHLVLAPGLSEAAYVKEELNRTHELAASKDIQLSVSSKPEPEAFNIVLVHATEAVRSDILAIHVPLQAPEQHRFHAAAAIDVLHWVQKGGLWVGVNNTRNAILGYLRFSECLSKND